MTDREALSRVTELLDKLVDIELDKTLSDMARRYRMVDIHNEIRRVCSRQMGFVDYIA